MLKDVEPGDDLFPLHIEYVDGQEVVSRRADWTDAKQAALDVRSIEYLLQFEENHGNIGLVIMIDVGAPFVELHGTEQERGRFLQFVDMRNTWAKAIKGAA